MIELTTEQQVAIASSEQSPPRIVDPATRETYVLVREEVYDRIEGVLEDDDARTMEHLLAEADPEDWVDASVYEGKP